MAKSSLIVNMSNGQIQNKKAVREFFLRLKDGRYILEADNSKKRTIPQNKFYWGLVVPMVRKGLNDLGTEVSMEETHDFLKARFNYQEIVNTTTGEIISIPKSTASLHTIEFMEFIAMVQQFAAEWLNVIIPDPGEQMQMDYDVVQAQWDESVNSIIVK